MINEFVQASAWLLLPFGAGVATGMLALAWAVNMMRKDDEEMECENCKVVEMCKKMFGKYWKDKSNGGKGCEHPVKIENEECKMENEKRETGNGGKILHSQFSILHSPLAAGAMENPETESLKRGAARTGEYVHRAGEVEKRAKPQTPRHAADASGGDLQRRNLVRCKGKAPCVETRRENSKDGGNSAHRITATASPHGKLNFVQEELI